MVKVPWLDILTLLQVDDKALCNAHTHTHTHMHAHTCTKTHYVPENGPDRGPQEGHGRNQPVCKRHMQPVNRTGKSTGTPKGEREEWVKRNRKERKNTN